MPATQSQLASKQGKLILSLLCMVAFMDFLDASIVNIALPSIRHDLGFSIQNLEWVISGYFLTYGGFMLLGGRIADLLGRRRFLIAGTVLFAASSLAGGLADSQGTLIGARLAQGVGAAFMLPAALSLLTTTFSSGRDRATALGAWGAMSGIASAIGVCLGGLLSEGPGWRWVFWVNLPVCAAILVAVFRLIGDDRRAAHHADFDFAGGILGTLGMLALVYSVVRAPINGWGDAKTLIGFAVAAALLVAFVINEMLNRNPLFPFSLLKLKGLAAADLTQMIGFAGFFGIFFFITLYMQNVLRFSPIDAGLAYVPLTVAVVIASGVSSQLIPRIGSRVVIVSGALISAAGIYLLSRIPVHGSYLPNLLPGLFVMGVGLGGVFVGVTTAANAGVPADRSGLAAALMNTSQQLGAALGIAILSAIATSHTRSLQAAGRPHVVALTDGFHRGLFTCALFLLAAAVIALRAKNAYTEPFEIAEDLSQPESLHSSAPAARAA